MNKKLILLAATLLVGTQAYAEIGNHVSDNDCDSNQLNYAESTCPPGYRIQGIIYNDLKGKDNADAVGAVCRHVKQGNIEIASDFYNRGNKDKFPIQLSCQPKEVIAGIACKDLPDKDALDGCTPICQVPGGPKVRMANHDIDSNPRAFVEHTVDLPNRVSSVIYKEEKLRTDRADCASITYRYEPIVK